MDNEQINWERLREEIRILFEGRTAFTCEILLLLIEKHVLAKKFPENDSYKYPSLSELTSNFHKSDKSNLRNRTLRKLIENKDIEKINVGNLEKFRKNASNGEYFIFKINIERYENLIKIYSKEIKSPGTYHNYLNELKRVR